jgi:outer membrane protein insertion porin family
VFCVLCLVPSVYSAETAGAEEIGNEDYSGLIDPWTHRPIDLFTGHSSLKWLGLPVVSIQYECDGEFSEEEVHSASAVQEGDVYSRSEIRKNIQRIYSLGGFSNVEVNAQLTRHPSPATGHSDGVMLTFILTNEIKTGNIYLEGNEELKLEEITEIMRLGKGREYDDSIAEMDVQSIKELYKSRGYFDVDVSFKPDIDDSSKQADIRFEITENRQALVKEIAFIGSNQAVMRTRETPFHMGLEFQNDLDNKNISEELLKEFENKGISLSDKAAISIQKMGAGWLITDVQTGGLRNQATAKVYSIRKEEDKLSVYKTKTLLEAMQEVRLGGVYKGERALGLDAKLIEEILRGKRDYITAKVEEAQAFSAPDIMEEYRGKGTHFVIHPSPVPHPSSLVTIVIEIEQGRRVHIEIEGDRDIEDDDVKAAIAVQRMHSVSESVLRKSDEDIENLYKLKGHYLAEVKHEVLKDEVWSFDTDEDAEGWKLVGEGVSTSSTASFHVSDKVLRISAKPISSSAHKPISPLLQSPKVEIDTDIYQKVHIRMRTNRGSVGQLYWTDKPNKWDSRKHQDFDVVSDNHLRDYEIDLRDHEKWSNKVIQLRLRPVDLPSADIDIESIKVTTESIPVVFTVDKGRLMRVREVSIKGDQGAKLEVPEEEIKKQMLTRKRNPFSFWPLSRYLPGGIFYEPIFEMDLRAIIAFYKDRGYPNARIVDYKPDPDSEKGNIHITIIISEGSRTYVSALILEGGDKDILGDKEVLSHLAALHGFHEEDFIDESNDAPGARYRMTLPKTHRRDDIGVFREGDIVAVRAYLRARYADEGYLAQIEPIKKLNDDRTEAVITYQIDEGKRIKIHDEIDIKVRPSGESTRNPRTKRHIIERELSDKLIKERIFSYTEIAASWQRLLDLGLFEAVRIDTEPMDGSIDGSEELHKMTIDVTERDDAISVNMHAGFSSSQDFRGGMEATHINLWGTGRRASGKYQIGTEGSSYELNYAEPRFLTTRALGLADVYRRSERDYNETRTGGSVKISHRLHRENTLIYGYRYDFVEYEVGGDERTAKIGSIETTFEREGRDNPLNPKRGWFHSLTLEYANPLLRAEETFAKLTMNSIHHSRLPRDSVLAIGGRAGYAWGLGGTELVLIPEQFHMRDYMTPRGYKWDEEDTGSLMFNVSMEVRFPIYKRIGAAAFFDSGCVCNKLSDFDIRSMKSSVGLGLRLITPIGPLRLDYGYPVRGNGKRNYWPHVAFGHAF